MNVIVYLNLKIRMETIPCRCKTILSLAAILTLVTGCGTPMALDLHKGNLTNLGKPIAIFTLRTENIYKPTYQPQAENIKVMTASNKEMRFAAGKPHKQGKNEYNEYIISMDLPPGDYSLKRIEGEANFGILVAGHFGFPINARFSLSHGITYLGHVKMVNRERKEGEERSGGVLPLMDQSFSGFSGGTFDITVTDRSETDIPALISAYPHLKEIQITKSLMRK